MRNVLYFLFYREDPSLRRAEVHARGKSPPLEVLAVKAADQAGISLSERQREKTGAALQWTMGISMGVAYELIRSRVPAAGAGRGLAYGAGVSLLVDEGLAPLLGLAPGPTAFPWQTHARGFAGHLVYGLVADTVLDVLNG